MKAESLPNSEHHQSQELFVAELTEAAYRVALRYGLGDHWLNVQLDLWGALRRSINHHDQDHQVNAHATVLAKGKDECKERTS